ncbi:MAG: ArdC-like ssDNA-binding domain-containing protein [Clostridium sp.]|uniref:ArdC-like ssDNA-binding domain-containing protein n=1 Tax=Clostridium sp. TaxID=1506 RepID=UPI0029053DF8|nr:ImmA/IrrE family metallo-endopeptidase [Clostridium sp.]MDU2108884.1 ArdC-like ssDNA-binding domain-containing protein [Clostridium sp.]MDU3355725.1 ArdC-like ssDNA-binding domain-containing protein [Clostridium sp.]MDU6809074.1 ArdC-like ssDNA-binding domain-containing protein [Clostridium sp.]
MSDQNKYKTKSFEEKKQEVDQLIESAEKKIEEHFISEESIKECLRYMSNFYNYSLNNAMLINNQFKGALAVGSYDFWKKQGYSVKKGEKGIKILVPIKSKPKFRRGKEELVEVEKATDKEKELIKNGELKVIQGTYFKLGNVFDISQTTAKASDLPDIFPNKWIEGDVAGYEFLYKGIEKVAEKIGVTIKEPTYELGVVKGASLPYTKEVIYNPRNGELQNIKTLFHELAHAKLHTKDTRENYTREEKEFQAEMVAYTMGQYFGLDTSDYSINYLHGWTNGKELKDKQNLLKEVRETTISYINIIEESVLKEVSKELEKYEGINFSSAKEAISIYNSIKENEKEVLSSSNDKTSFFLQKNSENDRFSNIYKNIIQKSNEKENELEM